RVRRPAVAGARARVPGRVGRLHVEAVGAVGQAAVALRARAGGEGTPVQRALEAEAARRGDVVGAGEGERGARRVGRVARLARDARARGGRVHRPAVAGARARVPGRVGRLHVEAVGAVGQAAVALRARAGGEG